MGGKANLSKYLTVSLFPSQSFPLKMRLTSLVVVLTTILTTSNASPPIQASIETGWPASDLVTQYL